MSMAQLERLRLIGRVFFAIGLVAFGILHLVYGDFVTRVVPSWPAWLPARSLWAYLTGALLIAGGATILLGIKGRLAAMILGALISLSFVILHVPRAAAGAFIGGNWTSAGKGLVLCGGCLAVAATFRHAERGRSSSILDGHLPDVAGRVCLGLFMVIPRAVAATPATRANETTAVFEALAFSGLAVLLAGNAASAKPARAKRA
jgi:uncharacterized membrane protein YphA (DoxX/SURF4 family)